MGGAKVGRKYGTFDPIDIRIRDLWPIDPHRDSAHICGTALLASNGGVVSGGGERDEEGVVAGLLRFAPSTPLAYESARPVYSALSNAVDSVSGVKKSKNT
jgi:hypothetical protein